MAKWIIVAIEWVIVYQIFAYRCAVIKDFEKMTQIIAIDNNVFWPFNYSWLSFALLKLSIGPICYMRSYKQDQKRKTNDFIRMQKRYLLIAAAAQLPFMVITYERYGIYFNVCFTWYLCTNILHYTDNHSKLQFVKLLLSFFALLLMIPNWLRLELLCALLSCGICIKKKICVDASVHAAYNNNICQWVIPSIIHVIYLIDLVWFVKRLWWCLYHQTVSTMFVHSVLLIHTYKLCN